MNSNNLIKFIENKFENISYPREKIIRGEFLYGKGKKLVSINYFDYSQNILLDNFNIDEYQDDLIAKDYYTHVGHPQWNFYLYFLCDQEKIKDIVRERIESDDKYTRKHVISFEWLDKLLSTGIDSPDALNTHVKEDLGITWTNKLKEKDLDGIFLESSYVEVVGKYIEGDPIKEQEIERETYLDHENKLASISKLKLDKYRAYPKEKEFIFEKVNLIKGTNGSGKTSLLEAIELCLCGKTFRNEDEDRDSQIALIYTDGRQDEFVNNNRKFQSRDSFWYGNSYSRGNSLHSSFNKYNFYDSDAAYRLAQNNDPKEIIDAFLSLALGKNANYIDERIVKTLKRFTESSRDLSRDFEKFQSLKKSQEKILQTISESKENTSNYFDAFISYARKMSWVGSLPETHDDSWIAFEIELSSSEVLLNETKSRLEWMSSISLAVVKKEEEKYLLASQQAYTLIVEIRNKKETIEKIECSLHSLNQTETLLAKILPYLNEKEIDVLDGLQDKLDKLSKEKEKLIFIMQKTKSIKFALFENEKEPLSDYEKSQRQLHSNLKADLNDVSVKIEGVKLTFSKLEGIISEIKIKGQEFLSINPEASNCPLCNAKYEVNDLRGKIKNSYGELKKSNILEDLFATQKRANNEIEKLESNLNLLEQIKEIATILFDTTDYSMIYFDVLIEKSSKINTSFLSTENEFNKLSIIKNKLLSKGLYEQEFIKLKEQVSQKVPPIPSSYNNRDQIKLLQHETVSKIKPEKAVLKTNKEALAQLIKDRNELFKEFFDTIEYEDSLHSELKKRAESLKQAIDYLSELSDKVSILSTVDITDILVSLQQFKSVFINFKNSAFERKENIKIVQECNKEIDKFDKQLKILEPKRRRVASAIESIENIQKSL